MLLLYYYISIYIIIETIMSLPIPESIDIEGDSVAAIWPAWRVNWGHYNSDIYLILFMYIYN